MTKCLYTLGIWLYYFAIRLAAWRRPKARQWVTGRDGWRAGLRQRLATRRAGQPLLWMHCASLGEFEQGRPLLEMLREKQPATFLLLTFFSPSGYNIRKTYAGVDVVTYLPIDLPGAVKDFLDLVRPNLAVLVKYEFWFNYLAGLHRRGVPVVTIAAVYRPQQLFFQPWGGYFLRQLRPFAHHFVQAGKDEQLLRRYGIDAVTVAGDPRVDRVLQIARQSDDLEEIRQFVGERSAIIVGSSWEPDEALLQKWWSGRQSENWCMIIAPHDIGEPHLQRIAERFGKDRIVRYAGLNGATLGVEKILLIDSIGLLASIYRYGRLAYVGGGFGAGIHNTLEPMAHGLPVIFGPRYQKFPEAVETVHQGGAFSIQDADELGEVFEQLLDPEKYDRAQQTIYHYMQKSQGATHTIYRTLQALLPTPS